MRLIRVWLVIVASVLAIATLVAAAPGNLLSTSDQDLVFGWTGASGGQPLSFMTGGITVMTCPIGLEGSFSGATMPKNPGARFASVHDADIDGFCTGGSATIDQESLPWHIRYAWFNGTLPNITSITLELVDLRVRFDPTFVLPPCTIVAEEEQALVGTATRDAGGDVPVFDADENQPIAFEGGWFCEMSGELTLNGNASVTTGRITLI